MAENKNVILSAKDLCKSFANNGGQVHILDNVNLEIYEKDFTVIMGASGSGKSTLLYCLSGMDSITSGSVFYRDKEISKYNEKKMAQIRQTEFGFIFQQMHLVSNLTLYENICVTGFLNKNKSSSDVKKKADELMKSLSIEKVKNHLPSQVSGGEQQRAAVARAIINEPSLVFADEPTGALNRQNTVDVLDILTDLNKKGQSILMVTHDVRAAMRATRILYLEDGSIKGEMKLAPFEQSQAKSRETQINSWLSSMEW